MDTRNRDFSVATLTEQIEQLRKRPELNLSVLYLDCSLDVLQRRYSETRRRHPLAPGESAVTGIRRELDLLVPIRELADILIDTSTLNIHQLRSEIDEWFAPGGERPLAISVISFSYKRGLPRGTDMLFDGRFLANPYWDPSLRDQDGRSEAIQNYVRSDPRFQPFFDRVLDLTRLLLPAYVAEGKSHFSIAFGCSGGRHRSVTLAESLAKALAEDGLQVSIRHRELEHAQRN